MVPLSDGHCFQSILYRSTVDRITAIVKVSNDVVHKASYSTVQKMNVLFIFSHAQHTVGYVPELT